MSKNRTTFQQSDASVVDQSAERTKRLRRWTIAGAAVSVTSLLALTALQYTMPPSFSSTCGLNHKGIVHFRQALHLGAIPQIDREAYTLFFRILLGAVWAGYFVALCAAVRGGLLAARTVIVFTVALAALLAVAWPASLSVDVYGYAGYARMWALYGQNPFAHTPQILLGHDDESVRFLAWNNPSPYGPTWMLLSSFLAWLLKPVGLWWQVIALKTVQAGALVGAMLAASRLADHLSPGKGRLTLLAVGLNPLLLIEGPANGHNDILMMFLLLTGLVFYIRERYAYGDLLTGLSMGIKLVTISFVPWILIERCRGRASRTKLSIVLISALLMAAPLALSYLPLWEGTHTFAGITIQLGISLSGSASGLHGQASMASFLAQLMLSQWLTLLAFAGLTVLVWRRGSNWTWTPAWVVLWGILFFTSSGLWLPWYLSWPLMLSLIRWDRLSIGLSLACCGLGLVFTMLYAGMW